ncbi:MAG TPA: Flp pilus assembly protein CpaB [Stellaceae bacterium]|nr:Flp pilus assembly protein CpaB [Stellaceae bacterium]
MLFFVSLSVVVILALRALPQRTNGDPAESREEILVAATTLQIGTLLRAKDLTWRHISGGTRSGQITRPANAGGNPNLELDQQARAEVYGAALRSSVMADEPIDRSAIVKPGDRDFLQVVLSPQARAIAIPVAAGGASTGILYPGDRVDVILTQTFKNDPPLTRRSVGETVVQNLRVLAIDPLETRPNGAANGFGRTVTLEVTPDQAEKVNVATELGKLSLTLRSANASSGAASLPVSLATNAGIKPIWAGDVSPALGDAVPARAVVAAQPTVEVIHGTKTATIKPE